MLRQVPPKLARGMGVGEPRNRKLCYREASYAVNHFRGCSLSVLFPDLLIKLQNRDSVANFSPVTFWFANSGNHPLSFPEGRRAGK
jgi:hypothetical protein